MALGFLPANQAKLILDANGITGDYYIDIYGLEVIYKDQTYWILQREIVYPGPTQFSPDGVHIVYGPTAQELSESQQARAIINNTEPSTYDKLIAAISNFLNLTKDTAIIVLWIMAIIILYSLAVRLKVLPNYAMR